MAGPFDRRRAGLSSAMLLLLILALAAAAGGWNYRRNLVREQQERERRPLAGYATEDLEALAEAHRDQVAALGRRYEGARGSRVTAQQHGFFADQIDEYERVRRRSGANRDAGADLAQAEAALRDVERELAARGGEGGSALDVHLRRLLTF
jgi:hypothetical protein